MDWTERLDWIQTSNGRHPWRDRREAAGILARAAARCEAAGPAYREAAYALRGRARGARLELTEAAGCALLAAANKRAIDRGNREAAGILAQLVRAMLNREVERTELARAHDYAPAALPWRPFYCDGRPGAALPPPAHR